jgi:hypothetical protein
VGAGENAAPGWIVVRITLLAGSQADRVWIG